MKKLTRKQKINARLVVILCIGILIVTFTVDYNRVKNQKKPIFCIKSPAGGIMDGGTIEYFGLGYKVIDFHTIAGFDDIKIGTWFMDYDDFEEEIKAYEKKHDENVCYHKGLAVFTGYLQYHALIPPAQSLIFVNNAQRCKVKKPLKISGALIYAFACGKPFRHYHKLCQLVDNAAAPHVYRVLFGFSAAYLQKILTLQFYILRRFQFSAHDGFAVATGPLKTLAGLRRHHSAPR